MNEEDRELFAELNYRYGDEEEKDSRSSIHRRRRSLLFKPAVFLVVIIFATLALRSFLNIFTTPSLDSWLNLKAKPGSSGKDLRRQLSVLLRLPKAKRILFPAAEDRHNISARG